MMGQMGWDGVGRDEIKEKEEVLLLLGSAHPLAASFLSDND